MSISHLSSPNAVRKAIYEFRRLGRENFLDTYGFGKARRYFLIYENDFYDSKAIAGVAYGYQFPDHGPLKSHEFVGGEPIKRKLEQLGFEVNILPAMGREKDYKNAKPTLEGNNLHTREVLKRYRGAMLGLAAGDALGTTLEFRPPGSFEPIEDMFGGGPFELEPGQ